MENQAEKKRILGDLVMYHTFQGVIGLKLSNKLKHPNFEFDSEEVRYTRRFGPFGCVSTPPMVPYSQYKVGARVIIIQHVL